MATYIVLNTVFMIIVAALLRINHVRYSRTILATLVVLLVLTAIFDNLIVSLAIVDYDPAKILGIKIGVAPIEDFMYALLAVMIIPTIWHKLEAKHVR